MNSDIDCVTPCPGAFLAPLPALPTPSSFMIPALSNMCLSYVLFHFQGVSYMDTICSPLFKPCPEAPRTLSPSSPETHLSV